MRTTTRPITVKPKIWYTSKTFWFNVITTAAAIISLAEFSAVLPREAGQYIALTNAVINIILRLWFTDSPVASKE